jgi:hypothetical protein
MRRQIARRQRFGAPRVREAPLPLPVGGLFADARTAEISGQFASKMENMRSNGVSIETMAPATYDSLDEVATTRFPFEFGGVSQYVIAGTSTVTAGSATPLSRAILGTADFGYISNHIIIADGAGAPIRFNGSAFASGGWTMLDSSDPTTLSGFMAHHDRPYFWRYGAGLDFYYGDVGAVQGDLTKFPLGNLGNITGEIAAITAIMQDASENLNDSLVIVTTTGWVVIYEGTNPGDAQDWRLAGRIRIAPPVSRDAFAQVAGDLWMVTRAGVVSILESVRLGQLALSSQLTRRVKETVDEMIARGGDFQLHVAADGESIIFSRYSIATGDTEQVIYHPISQSWSTANYPVRRWHNLSGRTQFTSPTGLIGTLEGDGTTTITATWHTGWLRLNKGSSLAWLQPTIIAKGALTLTVAVLTDHNETAADVAEAVQEITIKPDDPADPSGQVALNEIIAIGVSGQTYQLRMTMTATKAELVALIAGVT